MKRGFSLLLIFFLSVIFILSFSPTISAQGILYSNNQIIFLEVLGLNSTDNPFMINQEFQIPIQKAPTSSENSCTGAIKSSLDKIFSGGDDFLFEGGSGHEVVHPSLEETYTLKIENEIKQKREKISKVPKNKTIPKVVSQKEIKYEKIFKKLGEDLEFKKMYDYAKGLGYIKINDSIRVNYDNGGSATVSLLRSDDKKEVYLVGYSLNNVSQSFLMKIEKKSDIETTYITFFGKDPIYNEDWGITIDYSNMSLVEEWGHHSCSYGMCLWYGIKFAIYNNPDTFASCFGVCAVGIPESGGASLLVCVGCLAALGFEVIPDCTEWMGGDNCYYYPCLADCDEYDDYYDSGWTYYCNGDNRKRYQNYRNYYCPEEYGPREGSCEYNSYYKTDPEYSYPCDYGCSGGQCLGETTCYDDPACGDSGWIGNSYCSGEDVWQYWRDYDCHNPGTTSSYCDYDDDSILKQECVSGDCDDGECVGNCEEGYPWECNEGCWHCDDGDDEWSICCPDSGDPEWCCHEDGAYCDTGTGDCDVCGGDYPSGCNDGCWGCNGLEGYDVCCPSSGNPEYCCDATSSVCMNDGSCCTPSLETCNNLDDDCDGTIDSFNEGCGVGACAGGTRTCTAGSWGSCSTAGQSTSETCNNLDDDCDGSVDESLNQECGTDTGECVKGTQTCSTGEWGACGGSYVGATTETCNELDDNCNNMTDEDNACGDYPNVTIITPLNNYRSHNGSVTFTFSIKDNSNLANITLYHNINGTMSANETKNLSGTSNTTTWTINNIPNGTTFIWNCLVYDNDSHWSWSENGPHSVIVNTNPFFSVKNSTGDAVAWFNGDGNLSLKGNCSVSANCIAPNNSFIVQNSNYETVAYISMEGNLCVEDGDCSDLSATCNPSSDAFIIQNHGINISYIDFEGEMCLTGGLYENV